MANKGTLNGQQLMSRETWDIFHGNRTLEYMGFNKWDFSTGGNTHYEMTDQIMASTKPFNKACALNAHIGREGFIGWMGFGGSVFNWNPELEIGFGYVPFDFIDMDFVNKRGALIQQVVT